MLSLPPNQHGSAMQQKCLKMPHGCLGSINRKASSRQVVLVPTARKLTPQGHQHTGHCTAGEFKMKVSVSIQIQTRFQNTLVTPNGRELEPAYVSTRSEHNQVTNWVDPLLLWLVHNLVFQTAATCVSTPNWSWLGHHTNVSPRCSPHNALLGKNKGERVSGHLHDTDGLWRFHVPSSLPITRSPNEGPNLFTTRPIRRHCQHRTSGLWLYWSGILFKATWILSARTECFCNSSQGN